MINLYRILSAEFLCSIRGVDYVIKSPTPQILYRAEFLYQKIFDKNKFTMPTKESIKPLLLKHGLISEAIDKDLKEIDKNIENYKVDIYNLIFKEKEREKVRKLLRKAEDARDKRINNKHSLDHITAEGHASYIKMRYILANTTFLDGGNKLWDSYEESDPILLNKLYYLYSQNILTDKQIREIAKNNLWYSYWKSKGKALFGNGLITDEQRLLISYTNMYDSARKADKPPHDIAFEDDDMFDGWLIIRNREYEKEKNKGSYNDLVKAKPNAGEVFILAKSKEEIDRINEMNSLEAKMKMKQREAVINQRGIVNESELPDVMMDRQQKANQQFIQNVKGKRG